MKPLILNCLLFLIILFQFSCTEPNATDVKSTTKEADQTEKQKERIAQINSCKNSMDSINAALQWKQLKCGLWQNKKGQLGFKTLEGNEEGISNTRYLTELCCDGKSLQSSIDTLTFHFLGSSFYKDKQHIYTHYVMADGGNFRIVPEADLATFRVIGDCYAKDKNHIFGERAMVMDSVDYKTFKTKKGLGCFASDKNGYYFWDEKIELEDMEEMEVKKVIFELNRMNRMK